MSMNPRMIGTLGAVVALTWATAGAAAGASGPDDSADGAATDAIRGEVLNVAVPAPATGINPASVNTAFGTFALLAYEPLIYRGQHGLEPALAEEWSLEDGNTTFRIALRDGVTFADGTPVDAAAVKASLDYCATDAAINAPTMSDVAEIEVVDDLDLVITLDQPNPLFDVQMTQAHGCGMIISPAGLADIDSLTVDHDSAGAGAYVYSAGDSVPGSYYTYDANPAYYLPERQHYDQVVLHVMANPQSAFNALQTGQVDIISGDLTTMAQAAGAGFQVAWTPFIWVGLNLIDRDGEVTPELADVRVRQAINYAIDRETITTALLGEFAVPTASPSAVGFDGYSEDALNAYPYDPDKARELLAAAGYADGFTLKTLTVSFGGQDILATALQGQLAEVGIELDLTTVADEQGYIGGMTNREYSAVTVGYGSQPMFLMGKALVLPDGLPFNGFGTDDPDAIALFDELRVAEGDAQAAAAVALNDYLVDNAWFAPVLFAPAAVYAREDLGGVELTGAAPTMSVLDLYDTQ